MKYQHSKKDNLIIQSITTSINDHLKEWYGDLPGLSIMSPAIITYNNCFMLRFPLLGPIPETKNILVKIRRRSKMNSLNQAILNTELHVKIPAEYNDLLSLHEFFKDRTDEIRAIRPLIYLEKYFAIVMEEFQSQTLHEMLMDWKTILGFKLNIYNLVNAAQLTGKMLSVFHNQLHKCYEIEEPCQPIIEEVQALFERMTGANHKQNLANSVLPKFVQKIKALQTRKVLYSSNHGDMTTDNLLYSTENKVCLIDIKTKQAPIYSDIGLIMIHPDVFLYQIFTFGLLLRKQTIEAYRSAILKGYFGDRMIDKDLINLYCAIKMLDKWVMYEEIMSKSKGIKRLRSFLAAPFVRAYFKPRIDKYLNLINVSFQPK